MDSMNWRLYENKLKLGQAGVVAFAIIIGAVSMSSSSTVDARTTKAEANKNRSVNAGVALNLTDATELLTAGVTSALTYYGADVSVAQNDSNVVTASAQGAQAGDTAQETEQAMRYPRHRQPHRPVVTQILVCQLSAAET